MTQSGYYKVGLFTFLGLMLFIVLLIVLGSGSIFKSYEYAETYFDQSVQGLSVGSPVLFRGVRLGSVSEIGLCEEKYGLEPSRSTEEARYARYVYVRMQIEPRLDASRKEGAKDRIASIERMVAEGFRVRMAAQGLTGISVLEADYVDPLRNPTLDFDWDPEYLYVPSAPSTLVRIEEAIISISDIAGKLRDVDYESMGQNLNLILADVEELVASLEADEIRAEVRRVLEDAQAVSERVREIVESPEIRDIPKRAEDILGGVDRTVTELEKAATDLGPTTAKIADELLATTERFNGLVAQVEGYVSREEIGAAIDDVPGVIANLKLNLKRLNAILAANEADLQEIVGNMRVVSENLKDVTDEAKKYPSRVLFGDPPGRKAGAGGTKDK